MSALGKASDRPALLADANYFAGERGERTCDLEGCEIIFVPTCPHGRFCSQRCQRQAYNRRRRSGSSVVLSKCAGCGATLPSGRRKWCSDRCQLGTCVDCGGAVGQRGSVRCFSCYKAQHRDARSCVDCGGPVSYGSRRCRRCADRDRNAMLFVRENHHDLSRLARTLRKGGATFPEIAIQMDVSLADARNFVHGSYGACEECGGLCSLKAKRCALCATRPVDVDREEWLAEVEANRESEAELPSVPVVAKLYGKRKVVQLSADGLRFTEKQKAIIRLLQAVGRPTPISYLSETLATLPRSWIGWDTGNIYGSLVTLQRRRVVQRVRFANSRGKASFWMVPASGRQTPAALTLAVASREAELAVLVEDQEREVRRGNWAEVDFKTVSLDAQFGDDGGSFHDLLVAGDEPFKAGLIER